MVTGQDPPPRRQINDPRQLRALAHPLRLAVLQYLMAVGPRTASECAVEVGSTASNISWHLRHLAGHGLVEPVEPSDGRERPWRAAQVGLDFGAMSTDPVVMPEQDALIAASMAEESQLTRRFLDHRDKIDPRWLDTARLDGYVLRATPEEMDELAERLNALLRPYLATVRDDPPEDATLTYVGLRLFPRLNAAGRTE
ncbi:ArsR/SmtB family transcription factor [Streptomyces sp. NPDC091972]|uniref:helix-turn-helix domain-containing protein n=1 Tax=unclassified Streptomyces TaxID=2593676 RepID=UPI0034212472